MAAPTVQVPRLPSRQATHTVPLSSRRVRQGLGATNKAQAKASARVSSGNLPLVGAKSTNSAAQQQQQQQQADARQGTPQKHEQHPTQTGESPKHKRLHTKSRGHRHGHSHSEHHGSHHHHHHDGHHHEHRGHHHGHHHSHNRHSSIQQHNVRLQPEIKTFAPQPEWYQRVDVDVYAQKDVKPAGKPNKYTAIGADVKGGKNKVVAHYKDFKQLRDYRAQVLAVRNKIQDFFGPRFSSTRQLFGVLDLDRDGEISMDDWLQGIQLQRFPVSHEEAVRMFKAIDVNHDNSLQYSEVVNIFEPATTTSLAPNLSSKDADMLHGIAGFTDQQLKEFKIDEGQRRVDSSWHKDGPELKRRTSNPHIDVYGRMVPRQRASTPTKAQELDLLREKLDWRLCGRGTSSTSQRINNVFQDNDKRGFGYVDEGQFRLILQEKGVGLNLQLSDRETDLVVQMCADGTGAFEPRMFTNFMSTKFTSDAALIERGRDAEITTLQARVSAPPRAHTPHRLAGTSSHWAAHLKEHGVHTRPNTSHSPAAHRTGHTANPPMTPIRKSSSAANVLSSARSARSRHSKSRGSAHPVHGRARPSQRGNATRNVGFARAPGWQSSRSSRGGAGGGGGGATDRSIQSYLSATARSWAGGDTGRGGGVTTSKARRSAHLHHTNTELTTAATVVLTEAEANFKNNMRTVLPPAVHASPVLARMDCAAFGPTEERFVRTQAIFEGKTASCAAEEHARQRRRRQRRQEKMDQRNRARSQHAGNAGSATNTSARLRSASSAPSLAMSSARRTGVQQLPDVTPGLPSHLLTDADKDRLAKAARLAHKRRRFLSHHKRLHDYAVAREAKAAQAEAGRIHAKVRQQLNYLEALRLRQEPVPM